MAPIAHRIVAAAALLGGALGGLTSGALAANPVFDRVIVENKSVGLGDRGTLALQALADKRFIAADANQNPSNGETLTVEVLRFNIPQPGMLSPQPASSAKVRISRAQADGTLVESELVWVRVFLSGDRDNPSSEELIERIIKKVEREVR